MREPAATGNVDVRFSGPLLFVQATFGSPPSYEQAPMKPILVLDLGGVLADLGSPATAMRLGISDAEFWPLWLHSPAVAGFETGKLGYDKFLARLADEFPPEAGTIGDRLQDWRLRLYPGIEELLLSTIERYRVALLSNTNTLHWSQLEPSHDLFARFDKLFLSFEIGVLKPNPEAFLEVLRYFECKASAINFLDDSEPNVRAAQDLGIQARKVAGPDQLRRALAELSA